MIQTPPAPGGWAGPGAGWPPIRSCARRPRRRPGPPCVPLGRRCRTRRWHRRSRPASVTAARAGGRRRRGPGAPWPAPGSWLATGRRSSPGPGRVPARGRWTPAAGWAALPDGPARWWRAWPARPGSGRVWLAGRVGSGSPPPPGRHGPERAGRWPGWVAWQAPCWCCHSRSPWPVTAPTLAGLDLAAGWSLLGDSDRPASADSDRCRLPGPLGSTTKPWEAR
jgi:hypothetical protein